VFVFHFFPKEKSARNCKKRCEGLKKETPTDPGVGAREPQGKSGSGKSRKTGLIIAPRRSAFATSCLILITNTFSCANEACVRGLPCGKRVRWLGWSRLTDLARPHIFRSARHGQDNIKEFFRLAGGGAGVRRMRKQIQRPIACLGRYLNLDTGKRRNCNLACSIDLNLARTLNPGGFLPSFRPAVAGKFPWPMRS